MAATETSQMSSGSAWREISRMPTNQVPIVLGGFLAMLAGIVTYAFAIADAAALVAPEAGILYLVIFGALGLIGYSVSKHNVQNGSIVAAIAGLALVVLVSGGTGLLTGLLLLAGAVWSLASSR